MPQGTQTHKIDLANGGDAEFQILEFDRDSDGLTTARLEITGPEGKQWQLGVTEDVSEESDEWIIDRLGSYDADGQLAELPVPTWVDEVLMRLR